MKTIKIPRIETMPSSCDDSTHLRDFCLFILNRLTTSSAGAIYAQWVEQEKTAIWKMTPDADFIFEAPAQPEEIMRTPDLATFSSMIARLGDALAGNTYLGSASFRLRFEGEPAVNDRYVIVFSNHKHVGYWTKLQRIAK